MARKRKKTFNCTYCGIALVDTWNECVFCGCQEYLECPQCNQPYDIYGEELDPL